ncbi:ABC transporter substrate-binding protein [Desulfuromonas thiophila]|uniref:ABC transporter substrate-binding protein n=1 Tax=Desulfuromonas thiophila TaxID=57664 RepID=UPI0014955333|nr:ABC transporter substrate-binding protein [Desulfuromonas thiophila]
MLLVVLVCSCQDLSSRPLRVAVHPWLGYQSLILCQQEHRLDAAQVELVPSVSLSASSRLLCEGKVDAATVTLDEVLFLRQKGVPLTVVLVLDASAGADLLLAKPPVATLQALKGATIGMEDSALSRLILGEVLRRAGLTAQDVTLTTAIVSDHGRLWQEPEVDALITYLPLAEGIGPEAVCLFDSHQIPNLILDVLAVRGDRLDLFRPALKHLLSGHFSVVKKLIADEPDTINRLATILNQPFEVIDLILRQITFPTREWNRQFLSRSTPETNPQLAKLIRGLQQAGALAEGVDCSSLFDASFLPPAPERN